MRDSWEQERYQRERAALEGVAYPYYTYHRLCPMCGGAGEFRGPTNDSWDCPACEATGRQDQRGWLRFRITLYYDELNGLQTEIMEAEYYQPTNNPDVQGWRDRIDAVNDRINALTTELEMIRDR